jgi:mono/diheme cytochrome c family protein
MLEARRGAGSYPAWILSLCLPLSPATAGDGLEGQRAFLESHCTGCHGGESPKGDLDLEAPGEPAAPAARAVWEKVLRRVRDGEMPPRKRPRPAPADIEAFTAWIEAGIKDCSGPVDPGRVTIRRLNRAEYRNTIRDLLGVDFQPAEDFPSDDVGHGFDNIGDVLSLPPLLMEKYLSAAETISEMQGVLDRVMTCRPEGRRRRKECARKLLGELASRAYRRPAAKDEIEGLAGFVDLADANGGKFEDGIRLALQAVLVSPHFLFRVEEDIPGAEPGSIHPLGEFELATRLSYFLWQSMPDAELTDLAAKGDLRAKLEAQVLRMLADPKSRALVDGFAEQWLQIRNLRALTPDRRLFPHFDEDLRRAMETETEMVFEAVMREDRSILDLLEGDFTFVNGRLARHYGLPGVEGSEFRRVSLEGTPRRGILTHASILTVTSNPTRTSPVKRGKWVLEQVLGAPPPPPPPEVPDLKEGEDVALSGSLRERMVQHRADPACATCHEGMDSLGFALENFDAIGAWREKDGTFPIDASGVFPGGASFDDLGGMRAILSSRKDQFARCLTEKMMAFALGRGLEYPDSCAVDQVTGALAGNGYRFSALVTAIVRTGAFQMRKCGGRAR